MRPKCAPRAVPAVEFAQQVCLADLLPDDTE